MCRGGPTLRPLTGPFPILTDPTAYTVLSEHGFVAPKSTSLIYGVLGSLRRWWPRWLFFFFFPRPRDGTSVRTLANGTFVAIWVLSANGLWLAPSLSFSSLKVFVTSSTSFSVRYPPKAPKHRCPGLLITNLGPWPLFVVSRCKATMCVFARCHSFSMAERS